ncbi:MAG TPA: hypothetical protein VN643_18560 [Pyrinomonadaceae bacterium]|nr:hypothetical protein [Pyrinomonadaceae bacterium]
MKEGYTTDRLLALRRLTRAMADLLRGQMKEYISTLAPLMHPKAVLGNYVGSSAYEVSRTGERAINELREQYQAVVKSRVFNLPADFSTPLDLINPQLEMNPVDYQHVVVSGTESKTVTVTSPLRWALSYAGFSPAKGRALLADKLSVKDGLQQFVLHALMMHAVVSRQSGIAQILEALHFPLSIEPSAEFGNLPLCYISSSVSTTRLPDEVIIESTEISGMDAFEELVNIEDVARLRDPLKERLTNLIGSYV